MIRIGRGRALLMPRGVRFFPEGIFVAGLSNPINAGQFHAVRGEKEKN
jgi:hypothetical protein